MNKDTDAGDAASWTHDPPTNWAVGDLFIAISASKTAIDLTSGWTNLYNGSPNSSYRIQYKVAVSGDSTGWTFTSGGNDYSSVVLCYTETHGTTPINASNQDSDTSNTNPDCPSVTTDVDGCMILGIPIIVTDETVFTTTPSGYTNRDEQYNSADYHFRIDDKIQASYGATGVLDYDINSTEDYNTFTVALAPKE